MQKVITYIKKVKPVNPLTLFKKWLLTDLMVETERLDHRVDRLENNGSVEDVENRVENLEYDLESRIESVEDRSETNQESICIIKDDIKTIKEVDFAGIADRFNQLEGHIKTRNQKTREIVAEVLCDKGLSLNKLDKRVEALQGNISALTAAHNMAEELNKEARTKKQPEKERSEQSLSDMQKLTFEICKYYGGDFNLDDFNNCYDIIKKYDIKGGK